VILHVGTPHLDLHLLGQLGIVMSGMTLGFLIGPPIGGIMNEKIGYRSPFILSMGACLLDLIGRLLVIERDQAEKWARETSGDQEETPGMFLMLIQSTHSHN
jgi:predicted MFS family arabinose efflux permease